jgi:signal transduction histidine kinase/DNA-binding response OmpR family regulator
MTPEPMPPATPSSGAAPTESGDDDAGYRKGPVANILVVDDQADKILVYQTVLAELGENIVTATSGEEALRLMLRMDFAVVLLDVNMPVMDGFETAALIRRRKKLAHTPIIFVTAFGDEMHAAQGYSLGAVDYILTPVIPDVLRTKVRVFVQLYRMTAQIKQQAEDRIRLVQEQTARAAAEQAIRRAAFLAEASRELSGSLDVDAAGERLVRFVVPFMADLCALVLVDEQGETDSIKLAWMSSPAEDALVRTASASHLLDEDVQAAVRRSLESGGRELIRLTGERARLTVAADGADDLNVGHGLAHAAIFPLAARGRTLGVLLLGGSGARSFGPAEDALASELAGRVAIALDNARLYSKIREADRRKDEFLAMLAHELRNPLAPIRNAVEIMRLRSAPDAEPDAVCEVIGKEVGHMSRLVDDLLDVSRINRGKITLKLSAVELGALLPPAIASKQSLLDSRRQMLELSMPDAALWVRGDPVRLTQVIVNLVDNAAKFTPEGGRLRVGMRREGGHCELRIRDNGIGIDTALLPDVFQLFIQGERSLDRRMGGLGIGLALVKDLVELHGGKVQAHSDGLGKGSEFVVRLPLLEHVPDDIEPAAPVSAPSKLNHRILVVDDHVDAAMSLAMLLSIRGHTVETAHTGVDALRLAPEFRPRLAVLDIGLPGMDGYELAAKLLELPEMRNTTFIAMTGYGQPEDQRRSAAAGFHHHLIKPVEPATLHAIIDALDEARSA